MTKKLIPMLSVVVIFSLFLFPIESDGQVRNGVLKRLTQSGNNSVFYPCLSDSGNKVVYILEVDDGESPTKSIQCLDIETGAVTELFKSGTQSALPPFSDSFLEVGTKPPLISGDGKTAVFSLSIGESADIPDHYLAVVHTDGHSFKLFSFPIEALEKIDLKSSGFNSTEWERLSVYAISSDGSRIACVVKGHDGPISYGNPSGILVLDMNTGEHNTLLAPDFRDDLWIWPEVPMHPLTGGGWGFGLSGDGNKIVFGAQSSAEKTDYDLYSMDWSGDHLIKITDFKDRWFSLADISRDGQSIVFYYTGQKKQAIGSYLIKVENSVDIKFLQTESGSRIEFFDMSENGKVIAFLQGYAGKILDLETGKDYTAFDESTLGYAKGTSPMDFPRFPSFWCPRILNQTGDRMLLMGFPPGRTSPELYLLTIEQQDKK